VHRRGVGGAESVKKSEALIRIWAEWPGFTESRLAALTDKEIESLDNAATRARARRKFDLYEMVNIVNMNEKDRKRVMTKLEEELNCGLPKQATPMTRAERIAQLKNQEGPLRIALGGRRKGN